MVHFRVQFRESVSKFEIGFGAVAVLPSAEVYTGSYVVTPTIDLQNLPTGQKFLKYDMTVKAIPYYDVGNSAGGSTVYIGKEVE